MRRIFGYLEAYKLGGGKYHYTEMMGVQCVVFEGMELDAPPQPVIDLGYNRDVGFFSKELYPGEVDEAAGYDDTPEGE